jgi:predicted transcriptional regulator
MEEPDNEADERAIELGEADAAAGRVIPHDQVAKWLETWGTPREQPAPRRWLT